MKKESPRKVRSKTPKWEEEAKILRGDPGEWYLLTTFPIEGEKREADPARHLANGITQGKFTVFRPAGTFRGSSEKRDKEGIVKVFARYVGENGEYDT